MLTLNIGIIGAGIAGLSASIALRRSGHIVTIYEKSQFMNETGAAISFTPNANRVFNAWSLSLQALGETLKLQARLLNAETLECENRVDFSGLEKVFGYTFTAFHRVDIHKGLREMSEGLGVKILLGSEITELDCNMGTFKTKDGEIITKDLIVIASGTNVSLITSQSLFSLPT